jgi:hypothetical protein
MRCYRSTLWATFGVSLFVCAAAFAPQPGRAQTSPSPAPSPSSSPVPDPCGPIISVVTRPTVTTSACTVRSGKVLLENGWSNAITTGPGGGVTASDPQSLLKVGTPDSRFDFEFGLPNWMRSSTGGALVSGLSDVTVGAKAELGYSSKAAWGINGVVSLPTGDNAFTARESQYTLNGNWSYTLSSLFALAGTVGFNGFSATNASGGIGRYGAIAPSFVLQLTPTSTTEIFAEYAYVSKAGVGLPGKTTLDAGLAGDIGPHVQLDVEAGWSPTLINGQRQHSIGAGFSFMN